MEDKQSAFVGLKLTSELLERLDNLAHQTHRTRSAVIRIAIDRLSIEELLSYSLEPLEISDGQN